MYRETRYVQPAHGRLLVWAAAWFAVAPLVLGTGAVNVPGELIEAAILVGAGSMYAAVLLERRIIGAGMIAFVLFGLAMANVTTGLMRPGQFAFESLILNAVLYAFGALGIHLLVFEDMTYELRATNRRLETAQEALLQAAITDPLTGCHNRRFL